MHRRIFALVSTLAALASVPACASAVGTEATEAPGAIASDQYRPPPPPPHCATPAFKVSPYVRPADDSIAFGTLIEGAGYSIGASVDGFPGYAGGSSNWQDVTSGNVCGGAEHELLLMRNTPNQFSVLQGPTPHAVGAFNASSGDIANPWRAVTTGNLDGDLFDEVVAVRPVGTGLLSAGTDLTVMKFDPGCGSARVVHSATIGRADNSAWVDVAIGNFDGTGNQIAMLRTGGPNLVLVRRDMSVSFTSNLGIAGASDWREVAAGDLDGDGYDELIVARSVGDNTSATVLAYKWSAGDFHLLATTTFPSKGGDSHWAGMTVGDFNGDGRAAIALTKHEAPNFALFDVVPGSTTLRELRAANLDSAPGQEWRGVTAVDWLGGDSGAKELVAARTVNGYYRSDVFVYGNPFHRSQRDSALTNVKGQWDQTGAGVLANWLQWIQDTHTNLFNFQLQGPNDYLDFVEFLDQTRDFCVDGQQLRVAVTFPPWGDINDGFIKPDKGFDCALPRDSLITLDFDDTEDFANDPTILSKCKDYVAWSKLLGRLSQRYPHLVMLGLDDFLKTPGVFSPDEIALMQSNMRSQAPWMSLVPTAYSTDFTGGKIPDITRTVDSVVFYFRNDMTFRCIDTPCGENSIPSFSKEVATVASYLPDGRNMQVGIYYGDLWEDWPTPEHGSGTYDFNLTQLALKMGTGAKIGGVTAYPMMTHATVSATDCPAGSVPGDKYCVLKQLYAPPPVLDVVIPAGGLSSLQ